MKDISFIGTVATVFWFVTTIVGISAYVLYALLTLSKGWRIQGDLKSFIIALLMILFGVAVWIYMVGHEVPLFYLPGLLKYLGARI